MSTRSNKKTRGEDTSEGLKSLANARIEAAKIIASGAMDQVSDALSVLVNDYSEGPKKLTSDDMQTAIEFLSCPDKAAVFLSLSKKHLKHRDQWLERQASVIIIEEEQ
jgi:hypothetical protein